jgi:hypothetical protein
MRKILLLSFAIPALLAGCVATTPVVPEPNQSNRLTTGQVQLTLKKDETTQAEVLEVFG